jgi:hypothetical protein
VCGPVYLNQQLSQYYGLGFLGDVQVLALIGKSLAGHGFSGGENSSVLASASSGMGISPPCSTYCRSLLLKARRRYFDVDGVVACL